MQKLNILYAYRHVLNNNIMFVSKPCSPYLFHKISQIYNKRLYIKKKIDS